MMSYGGDDDEDRKEIPIAVGVSFYDDLEKQLNLVKLDGRQYVMAIQIIGSIDDDGYLRRPISSLVDDLAFSQNVIVDDEDMEEVLYIVQQFDTPGIAADRQSVV